MSIQTMINDKILEGCKEYQRATQRKFRESNPEYYKQLYQKNAEKRRQYAKDQYHKKKLSKDTLTDVMLYNFAHNVSAYVNGTQ